MNAERRPPIHALAMLGVDRQKRLRGAVSTSSTNIDQSGLINATVSLLQLCLTVWRGLPNRDITETDGLDFCGLSQRCYQVLVAHPDLGEPTSELRELNGRLQTLKSLRGRKPSKVARDIDVVVNDTVSPVVTRLRSAIDDAAGHAPHRIKETVDQLRATLSEITLPEPNAEPITVFGRIISALGSLNQRRLAIPRKTLEFVEQRLTERALPEYDRTLAAFAEERIGERLKQEIIGLEQFLSELLARSAIFEKNVAAIQSRIEEWRTEALHTSNVSKASVILELPGPTENEITTGLLTRLGCKDQLTLAKSLLAKWESALREHAVAWLPTNAPFGLVLTHLDAALVADTFRRVIDGSLGEGHSLFEIIERAGITPTALDLYDRAEHLCQLRSRDIEQYNVNPCSVTIVRLPPPIGPRDAILRDQLATAFLKLGHCSLVESSASERNAITVIRTTVGWPVGIEGGNLGLLQEYARAGEAGHLPHLIGIVPGTEFGEPIPGYVDLACQLHPIAY